MSEQNEQDKYIKCKGCQCKYINDDEHIEQDFGYNRFGEKFKSCVKCRNKSKKGEEKKKQQSDTIDTSKPIIKVDDEIYNYVVRLMTTLTTKQLDKVILSHNTKHVFAYAEKKLNRKERTFRKLSWQQVLPLIVRINNEIDHPESDDDSSDDSSNSYQCVYDASDDEVGFRNM
jgi:hypothetical protein